MYLTYGESGQLKSNIVSLKQLNVALSTAKGNQVLMIRDTICHIWTFI